MNQQLIEKILDYAVCHGADFAEVFYEDVRRSNLTVLDQKVLDSSAGAEKGVGIRLFRGTESAYLYTADLSEENLLTMLRAACQYRDGSFDRRALEELRQVALNPHCALSAAGGD